VNVDFEDVRTVMSETGKAMMGTAAANGPDRARIAAEQAVACPLLEGVDMSGAKGVLVLITAAKGGLKLSESREAMNTIRKFASPDAHVIYGTAYDESLATKFASLWVATGLAGSVALHLSCKCCAQVPTAWASPPHKLTMHLQQVCWLRLRLVWLVWRQVWVWVLLHHKPTTTR